MTCSVANRRDFLQLTTAAALGLAARSVAGKTADDIVAVQGNERDEGRIGQARFDVFAVGPVRRVGFGVLEDFAEQGHEAREALPVAAAEAQHVGGR